MRHTVWLAGCLLVLSCTVNNDNLNTDAGRGSGGVSGSGGSGGVSGSGGVTGSGGAGGSGAIGSGGVGGCPRCAGTGGASATGGQVGTGGQSATGGQTGTGGSSTGGHGAGGSGAGGGGGQGGGKSCDALETDYGNAMTAAKKCTLGASGQCQQLVNGSLSCPGCKQYVNDATTLSAIQADWDSQNCSSVPHVCPAIACVVPTNSVCTTSPAASGPGTGADSAGTCNPPLTPTN